MEITEVLKCLHDHYAVLFEGIDAKYAQQASVSLVKAGVPPIPLDYVSFLTQTNGLFWNGVTLFSLDNIEREKGAFHHPGILKNFQFSVGNAIMKKRLLLGYGWETLLVYDSPQREYILLDRYTYDVIMNFSTILAFLEYAIKPIQTQQSAQPIG